MDGRKEIQSWSWLLVREGREPVSFGLVSDDDETWMLISEEMEHVSFVEVPFGEVSDG